MNTAPEKESTPVSSPATPDEPQLRILLWLVAVGFFMQTLDATIVNTALPAMARSLNTSPLRMQTVLVAYSLTMAVLIPISGWVADRFGTRRVFMGAILVFTLGSLLCGLSYTVPQLVAARVVQGAGGALMFPVGRLAVLRAYPRDRFLDAMSFVAIPGLIGPLLGPTLGGWLVQMASWHWIFFINLPVGLVGWAASLRYMPDFRGTDVPPLDKGGYALLALGMMLVSLSVDVMADFPGPKVLIVIAVVFGLASLAAYWLRAARQDRPLFSPRLFAVPALSIGLLGNLFSRLGSSGVPFLIPLLMQLKLGYPPAQAGMMMLPIASAGMLVKRFATWSITRYGYRRVLVLNTLSVGLLIASFSLLPYEPLWLMLPHLAIFGASNSLQFTAMNTLVLRDLNSQQASSGNSLLSMTQMLAISLGVALAGTLLVGFSNWWQQRTGQAQALQAFQAALVCMGTLTLASAWIFWQLSPQSAMYRRIHAHGALNVAD
ncbi:MAG: multidrug transporter subunit MdtD [Brachymonas sp.]|nr:multidrug transporter subunit MdtD [Brachymonas sp.]